MPDSKHDRLSILRELNRSEVGFDYSRAVLELNRRWSYEQIAGFCGYKSKSPIADIVGGAIPNHPAGERLYILYVETFGSKPPNVRQSEQQVIA